MIHSKVKGQMGEESCFADASSAGKHSQLAPPETTEDGGQLGGKERFADMLVFVEYALKHLLKIEFE
jgi:hypothetical protein